MWYELEIVEWWKFAYFFVHLPKYRIYIQSLSSFVLSHSPFNY